MEPDENPMEMLQSLMNQKQGMTETNTDLVNEILTRELQKLDNESRMSDQPLNSDIDGLSMLMMLKELLD